MRRPHLSTGAWLFFGFIAAALITPAGVYAAVNSRVAIGNPGNTTTATVDLEHQLLTTTVAPNQILRISGAVQDNTCPTVYTAPAGQAFVALTATVQIQTDRVDGYAYLANAACDASLDAWYTTQAYFAEQHTYPSGLPLGSEVRFYGFPNAVIWVTGYLIPASQMPPAIPATTPIHLPKHLH